MQTLTIRVNNIHALKLLEELEALNLIQMVDTSAAAKGASKLSERLNGSITTGQAELMRKELQEMRNGWERNIL